MGIAGYLIALAGVTLGAVAQGSLGFGLGMLAAPVLALVDDRLVPGPLLLLGVTFTGVVALRERADLDWRGIRWAIVGRVIGTVVGAVLVTMLAGDALAVVLGLTVLVAVGLSVAGWQLHPTTVTLLGAGTMSGVMGTLTSIGGPPIALVYQREKAATLRSTLAGFFFVGATLSLVALTIGGDLGAAEFRDGLLLLPGLGLGLLISRPLRPYLDRGWTRPGVLGLAALASLVLVVQAIL
jgi:uncharacterized membrane protein YfcA